MSNFRVTVLVENLSESRQYTVEEVHSSEDEISSISVQDPLRSITQPHLSKLFFMFFVHKGQLTVVNQCETAQSTAPAPVSA